MTIRLSIQAVVDPVCPFCYIGALRLTRAIEVYRKAVCSDDIIHIDWHSYQIDPDAITQPVVEKMASRLGGEHLPQVQQQLVDMGLKEGIKLTFESTIGNTRDAHRLIQLAKKKDAPTLPTKLVLEIMRMYFEQGGDITSARDLGLAAERAGIDKGEAMAWLADGGGADEVEREVEAAQRMGIREVPWYKINGWAVLPGVAEERVFLSQLVQARGDVLAAATG